MPDPKMLYDELIGKANAQQKKTLAALNLVLSRHYEAGEKNFSIAEIARLSTASGGPSASTIRNKTGLCFRQLIEAWAGKAGLSIRKPINPRLKSNSVPKDNELLRKVDDPALRGVFGMIIAERNRFRNELNILRSHSNVVIDLRPKTAAPLSYHEENGFQVMPALSGILNPSEVEALESAIDEDFIAKQGWIIGKAGQIRGEFGPLYKHGYVNAIKKILCELR